MQPSNPVHEAIVLAGGFGARLRGVVSDVPKPLAPIAGRPFLLWLLDLLAAGGLQRVVLATGYLGEMIEAAVGDAHAGLTVAYSRETVPLGTGGAVWQAMQAIEGPRAFVLNGDTLLALDYRAMAASGADAEAVIAVRDVPDRARYGSVTLEGARVSAFGEKALTGPGLVNCGAYLLRRDLIERFPLAPPFSLERDVLQRQLAEIDLRAFEVAGDAFIDIGTPEDYARAQTLIPQWVSTQSQG